MQVSLPHFFINKQKHNNLFLPSLRDLQRGSEDAENRDEIPRDIEVDITDGEHNEEDP